MLQLIDSSKDLYALKKRFAYLVAFIGCVKTRAKGTVYYKPITNVTTSLHRAFLKAVKYVQSLRFGPALKLLTDGCPDDFDIFLKRFCDKATNREQIR